MTHHDACRCAACDERRRELAVLAALTAHEPPRVVEVSTAPIHVHRRRILTEAAA
jgi:hypothetical protein